MSTAEKMAFCPGGKIIDVECATTGDTPCGDGVGELKLLPFGDGVGDFSLSPCGDGVGDLPLSP
jgi:hypothetical protein